MWTPNAAQCTADTELYTEHVELFQPFVTRLMTRLHEHFQFEQWTVLKLVFAKLPAGTEIIEHRDTSWLITAPHRLHVPIVTNKDVDTFIAGHRYFMEPGKIYDFNNTLPHSVVNRGDTDRVNLMIDFCEPHHVHDLGLVQWDP